MAELKLLTADIKLTAAERRQVVAPLSDVVKATSTQRTTELEESFAGRRRFRDLLSSELEGAGVNVDRLRSQHVAYIVRRDRAATNQVKRAARAWAKQGGGEGKRRSPNAVWGLTSGVEVPRYDFAWTFHNTDGSPITSNMRHVADQNTGRLDVFAHGHDSSPKMVDSYAGVGFWYIPNRSGLLTVNIGPHVTESLWTGASWNDVGAAGGWISLGIARYLREPFRFVDWAVIDRDQLWWNVDNWFDFTTHNQDHSAYGMSASAIADTAHYYACWCWIEAYAYAENGGSYAGSSIQAAVSGFTYNFL